MKLIKGAAILGIAALLSKLLGAVYRFPYQNITGDVGLYVYAQVYPVYTILLFLATSGFPPAISKTVSEKLVAGDREGAKRIFRISAMLLFATGVFFFLLLYILAPSIGILMAGDRELAMPIRSISFALLIVPVMAALRGYFQGHQNMMPTAVSQIVEQLVRVATILVLSYWFIASGYSVYHAGAGAVFGAVTGSFASLLILIYFWMRSKNREVYERGGLPLVSPSIQGHKQESAKQILINLFKIAIPMAAGTLVLPLMQMVDTFSVKNLLDYAGYTATKDLTGILGRGQPLVQFAAFVATPLSLALLPAISEANALRKKQTIQHYSELAMRLTLYVGLPAAVGLALIAEPVNIFLYTDNEGTAAIAVLAFTSIFSTLGITTNGILYGVGIVMRPARNLLIGVFFKVILNLILIPFMGITGAALATVIGYMVATILNLLAVNKYTGTAFTLRNYVTKPLIAVGVMAVVVILVELASSSLFSLWIEQERLLNAIIVVLAVGAAASVYGIMLFITGAIRTRDLEAIPRLRKLTKLLQRLRLLRQ